MIAPKEVPGGVFPRAKFQDRVEAGRRLADAVQDLRAEHPIVLGLPRGGVPVAAEVARRLDAPLDVLVVRKIGHPEHPELAIGAIADGARLLDEPVIRRLGVPFGAVDRVVEAERAELARREQAYRQGRPAPDVRGRTVILVDDGLATGLSAEAAIASVRQGSPKRVVLAVPVCAAESAARLSRVADRVVCVAVPRDFRSVGHWYDDFRPTGDAEVLALLEESRTRPADRTG